jgi:hypothetical protein
MWFSLLGPPMNHNVCEWALFETTVSTNDGFFTRSALGMTISTKTGRRFEYWRFGQIVRIKAPVPVSTNEKEVSACHRGKEKVDILTLSLQYIRISLPVQARRDE